MELPTKWKSCSEAKRIEEFNDYTLIRHKNDMTLQAKERPKLLNVLVALGSAEINSLVSE